MADVYTSELDAQAVEIMHFGFSPVGFTDQVYNCALECWVHVVENILMKEPMLKGAADEKKLKKTLIDMIFFPSFTDLCRSFKNYVIRHIFRIPPSVTLPVHKDVHKLTSQMIQDGDVYSVTKEEHDFKKKEHHISKAKMTIEELDKQIAEADAGIAELRLMIQKHKDMKRKREEEKKAKKQEAARKQEEARKLEEEATAQ